MIQQRPGIKALETGTMDGPASAEYILWVYYCRRIESAAFLWSSAMSERCKVFSISLLMIMLVTTGCGGVADKADGSAKAVDSCESGEQIVGYLNGEAITRADLELEVTDRISEHEIDRNNILKSGLDRMIANQLFQQEANALGITQEELFQVEVEAKVAEPTEIEVRNYFEEHKHEAPEGTLFENVKERITTIVKRRAATARSTEYLKEVMAASGSQNLLEPPKTVDACGGGDQIVGYLNEEASTLAVLEQELINKLREHEIDRYNTLKSGLETMLANELFQQEADALGITLEDLILVEVGNKVPDPTELDVRNFFEEHKHEAPEVPVFEDVKDRISNVVKRRALKARRYDYLNELMAASGSKNLLDPPRTSIEIPELTKMVGPPDAPITLVEFADYQCPACKRAYPLVNFILSEYKDQIQYAFIDFPLDIHDNAVPASVAAHCADDQELFWDYHQNLMLMVGDLGHDDLIARAANVGLDVDQFTACLDSNKDVDKIEHNIEMARQFGVNRTPTFFVNGRYLLGITTTDEFRTVIEEELKR